MIFAKSCLHTNCRMMDIAQVIFIYEEDVQDVKHFCLPVKPRMISANNCLHTRCCTMDMAQVILIYEEDVQDVKQFFRKCGY